MSKEKNIKFSILNIKTEQFAILGGFDDKKDMEYGVGYQFKLDPKLHIIGAFLDCEFVQNKKQIMKIVVSCQFKIDINTWKEHLHEKENAITFPKGFLGHLAMITTGTARGVLFAKNEGTEYSRLILPTVNVNDFIKTDVKFNLNLING